MVLVNDDGLEQASKRAFSAYCSTQSGRAVACLPCLSFLSIVNLCSMSPASPLPLVALFLLPPSLPFSGLKPSGIQPAASIVVLLHMHSLSVRAGAAVPSRSGWSGVCATLINSISPPWTGLGALGILRTLISHSSTRQRLIQWKTRSA